MPSSLSLMPVMALLLSLLLLSVAAATSGVSLQLTGSTPFSPRSNPQLATIGGRVYLQGGINPSAGVTYGEAYLSDSGGRNWTQLETNGLPLRYSGALVNLPNANASLQLYLLGGADNYNTYNDLYLSSDGLSFTSLGLAAFSARQSFAFAVATSLTKPYLVAIAPAGPAIFVLGGWGKVGSTSAALNDVWYSVGSGSSLKFVPATVKAPWAARVWHQTAVVQDSSRLVVAGGTSSLYGGPQWFNDVWIGDVGGFSWTQLTSAASFPGRAFFGMVSVSEQLFLFAGRNSSIPVNPAPAQTGDFDDLWSSLDYGTTWQQNAVSADFTARARFSTATVGNNLVLVGGDQGDQRVYGGALLFQPLSATPVSPPPPPPSTNASVSGSTGAASPVIAQQPATNSLSTGGALRVTGNALAGVMVALLCGLLAL